MLWDELLYREARGGGGGEVLEGIFLIKPTPEPSSVVGINEVVSPTSTLIMSESILLRDVGGVC